jgi:hypothetical protein
MHIIVLISIHFSAPHQEGFFGLHGADKLQKTLTVQDNFNTMPHHCGSSVIPQGRGTGALFLVNRRVISPSFLFPSEWAGFDRLKPWDYRRI